MKRPSGALAVVVIAVLLQICCPVVAQAQSDHSIDASLAGPAALSLTPDLDILEDPGLALTFADVQQPATASRFKRSSMTGEALNYGFSRSAYWVRLSLRNDTDKTLERMLEIAANHLSNVEFHHVTEAGPDVSIITGDVLPFSTRAFKNRYFVFPLSLPRHSTQVMYLRIHHTTGSVFIPLRLWEPQAFHVHERQEYVGQAWYLGLALGMVLFNLLLFISLRESLYLKYVSFVTCMAASMWFKSGIAKEQLPDDLWWSNLYVYVGYSLTLAALLVFMRHMLNTAQTIARLDRLLKLLITMLLLSVVGFALALETLARWGVLLYMLAALVILGVALYCAFLRQRTAYFFCGAFFMLCFGAVVTGLYTMGLLPVNTITSSALQLGSVADMLLLALAMADRFNQLRHEKVTAQSEALAAQQLLVTSLQASEQVLEARVAQRTEELQLLNHKLETLSATDGLTSLANRRRFDEVLVNEWLRARRFGQPLALVMIDVDWFKKFNDHYGHLAGDACLRSVARVLAANVRRSGDLVARYGGEEFAIIAPMTDSVSAWRMSEAICQAVAALALPHQLSEFGCVTLSIGVAAFVPQPHETPDMLVKLADEMLYQAKSQGRNRAVRDLTHDSAADTRHVALVPLVWKEAFACGNSLIDSQHKALVQVANELFAAMLTDRSDQDIALIVASLLWAASQHFQDEEGILRQLGFASLEQHAAEHAQLLTRAHELVHEFERDKRSLGSLFQFLAHDVIIRHILGSDREYFELIAR
jgi:diguanylate cyclase (GGDEF)-like protein/hemerythrin-like metal-binding protein